MINKTSILVLCVRAQEIEREILPSSLRGGFHPEPSPFGSHDFPVAATEPSGLDRTKKGGSYTPS